MTWLMDTDTCVTWLRNTEPQLIARIQQCDPAEIVLCSIVVAELRFGVERSNPAHRAKTASSVARLRQLFTSLPFDDAAAEHYGRIRADLTTQGQIIGGNDLMIASIALAHGCTLVTHNTAEFGRVAGLRLEDWHTP